MTYSTNEGTSWTHSPDDGCDGCFDSGCLLIVAEMEAEYEAGMPFVPIEELFAEIEAQR